MRAMLKNFTGGALYVLKGLKLLAVPALRPYVLIPLAISILLFVIAIAAGFHYFSDLLQQWLPQGTPDWLPGWLDWLSVLVDLVLYLLWGIFLLVVVLVVFFTFSLVANLIASPFNTLLATAVERYLGGTLPKGGGTLKEVAREAIGAILSELRKLLYFALWAIPLLLLFWVPGVQVLWLLYGAWMLALEYVDYPLGNHGISFPRQRELLRRHRPLSLGFGSAVTLLTMLPLFNFIAMPAGVAGATLMWWERLREESAGTPGANA